MDGRFVFLVIEKDIKGLEALYERLESANINIIESGRVFEEEKVKEYDGNGLKIKHI